MFALTISHVPITQGIATEFTRLVFLQVFCLQVLDNMPQSVSDDSSLLAFIRCESVPWSGLIGYESLWSVLSSHGVYSSKLTHLRVP